MTTLAPYNGLRPARSPYRGNMAIPLEQPPAARNAARATAGGGSTVPAPGSATTAPLMPMTPFRQSLDNERADDANAAARFAAKTPLPHNADGVYNGAYGIGPEAEQSALAAKSIYINRQRDTANAQNYGGMGPNYFRNQEVEDQAINRQNAQSAADVALTQTKGELNQASAYHVRTDADTLLPSVADKNYGAAANSYANATAVPYLTDARVKDLNAGAGKKDAEGQAITDGAAQHKEMLAQAQKQLTAATQRIKDLESKLYGRPGRNNATDSILNALKGANTSIPAGTPQSAVPMPSGVSPGATGLPVSPPTPYSSSYTTYPPESPSMSTAIPYGANIPRPIAAPSMAAMIPLAGGSVPAATPAPAPIAPTIVPKLRTPNNAAAPAASQGTRTIGAQEAAAILNEAGGDKNRARQIARSRGLAF